jgi:hypothetical protein
MLDKAVAPKLIEKLTGAVRSEGADLHWLDEAGTVALTDLLRRADDRDLHIEDRLHERTRWIGGDRPEEGVPDAALGPQPGRADIVRDLAAGFERPDRGQAVFERHPVIAVLTTPDEDDNAWPLAGMALQRMLLTATSYSLAASFLNQPLEYPDLRLQVRDLIGDAGWPQMIIRLGYPAHSEPATTRRLWQDTDVAGVSERQGNNAW